MFADLHTHTRFSADGKDSMDDMCRAAVTKRLSWICFSDHLDSNPSDAGCNFFDYEGYSEAVEQARKTYRDRLNILKGIEFSEPHLYQEKFKHILNQDFDVVIAGIHYLGPDYVGDASLKNKFTNPQRFAEYYKEVLKTVKLGGFDILAHFDLPKRYLKEPCELTEIVDEILSEMIKKGIALEINTSPLRRGLTECCPDSPIVERYIKAGGKRFTTGSDAHRCGEVAAGFEYAQKMIRDYGGTVGIFRGREFNEI